MTELQKLLHKLLNAMDESQTEIAMSRQSNELSETEHHAAAITDLRKALEDYRNVTIRELIDPTVQMTESGSSSGLKARNTSERKAKRENKTKTAGA